MMKEVVVLLIGVAIGAVLALLFAPESGQELRAEISSGATAEREKLDAQLHQSLAQVQDRVDKIHQDLTTHIQRQQQPDDVEATESSANAA